MRIGILTQPLATNYGGILQNYALQTVLKRMGHEPYTFNLGKYTWFDWTVDVIKYTTKKILIRETNFPRNPLFIKRLETPLRSFVEKNITLTPRIFRPNKKIVERYNFEAIIVGSDQVWRPKYNRYISDNFLGFAKNMSLKRLAYAASFGVDKWEYINTQTVQCTNLARTFNAISVREASGVDLCEFNLNVKAIQVLDPTFLLNVDDYKKLCSSFESRDPFVFAYVLDESEFKIEKIRSFAESKHLPFVVMSAGPFVKKSDSVEKWLSYFRDAAYVITDSFHGTAFSIIFNKEFYIFDNGERGNSRFESLLSLFGLSNRLTERLDDRTDHICWKEINKLREDLVKSSKFFLHSKLSDET